MNELSTPQIALIFTLLFVAGKVVSVCVYQFCWRNSIGRDLRRHGPTWWLSSRLRWWPIHIAATALTAGVSWDDLPGMHPTTCVVVTVMTVAAVFRFGAVDRGRFFIFDRCCALLLCAGVYFSPAFIYPSIMVSCCLQYVVSASPLSPGYSNLLGFEFLRGSACVLLACVAFEGAWGFVSKAPIDLAPLCLAVLISVQASHYVNHAVAKAWLGPRWYSWILNNRIECLIVNSYLRGWASTLGEQRVLRLASTVGRFRIALCGAAWALEFAFIAVLWDHRTAAVLLLTAAAFHLALFVLTGLAEFEYVVNHVNWAVVLLAAPFPQDSSAWGVPLMLLSVVNMLLAFVWVGVLRARMLQQYQQSGNSPSAAWADPFDHLMAWWDSPYMRMWTYVVETPDGSQRSFPVTKLSPYDTAMTDIHTHMMILNLHPGLDRQADDDKRLCRAGVWGLVITTGERDRLYSLMDQAQPDLSEWCCPDSAKAWVYPGDDDSPAESHALWDFFVGLNSYRTRPWFRCWMRYPHFPGEDLAPDICPLGDGVIDRYQFDQPIASVRIQRVKTFYTGDQIEVIERSDVGVLKLSPDSPTEGPSGNLVGHP